MNLNHLNTHIKELYTIIWILRNFKNLLSKANNSISLLAILKNVDRCHFTIFLICVKQTISQTGVCKSKNIKLHSCSVGISIPNYYFIHLFKDLSKKNKKCSVTLHKWKVLINKENILFHVYVLITTYH